MTVGLPVAIATKLILQGEINLTGVKIPVDKEIYEPVLEELKSFGIDFVEEAKEGDLALFEKRKGKVVHVGLVLPGKQVIHVDGTVRVDYFDHYGIFNKEDQKYSHKLRIIRRVLLEDTPLDFSVPSGGFGKSAQQITMF